MLLEDCWKFSLDPMLVPIKGRSEPVAILLSKGEILVLPIKVVERLDPVGPVRLHSSFRYKFIRRPEYSNLVDREPSVTWVEMLVGMVWLAVSLPVGPKSNTCPLERRRLWRFDMPNSDVTSTSFLQVQQDG